MQKARLDAAVVSFIFKIFEIVDVLRLFKLVILFHIFFQFTYYINNGNVLSNKVFFSNSSKSKTPKKVKTNKQTPKNS